MQGVLREYLESIHSVTNEIPVSCYCLLTDWICVELGPFAYGQRGALVVNCQFHRLRSRFRQDWLFAQEDSLIFPQPSTAPRATRYTTIELY